MRDLPCFEFRTTVVELYRVRCPDCGVKTEKVPQLPSKAPFSKRFEDAVGLACESAAVRRVARQFGLVSSTIPKIQNAHKITRGYRFSLRAAKRRVEDCGVAGD